MEQKNKDYKKITTIFILIVTLIICETGATYAFFAITATSTGPITGTAASAELIFSVEPTLVSPASTYASKPMVPQYAYNNSKSTIQLAVTGGTPVGTTKVPCVDDNGNVICKVYTFTIQNNSTAAVDVSGTINFAWTSPSTFTNLKWAPMSNATTVAAITSASDTDIHAAATTPATFTDAAATPATSWNLEASGTSGYSKQFWFVVWINETNNNQSSVDKGTWTATLTFTDSNGKGITSTIIG